ncbi:hypothetical protein ACH79_33310 [Bradyrhizobium sp. CCBAU 051011]|uniref:hypothetical protein n=1 Tax=Bradyrhizobium sp. CCBAU 051011 TaxID=858422 RepID=UPI0013744C88|nr:hypothetical protein [Bradyrhizobium sp. CCBAU 051011]QHO76788.1 hypothetical protein ACH79_33310 [Bradyrhizobium sp. CCBAU 051011]
MLPTVQTITVAIDQYAEKALGNRDYFLNKPYGVGEPGKTRCNPCSGTIVSGLRPPLFLLFIAIFSR